MRFLKTECCYGEKSNILYFALRDKTYDGLMDYIAGIENPDNADIMQFMMDNRDETAVVMLDYHSTATNIVNARSFNEVLAFVGLQPSVEDIKNDERLGSWDWALKFLCDADAYIKWNLDGYGVISPKEAALIDKACEANAKLDGLEFTDADRRRNAEALKILNRQALEYVRNFDPMRRVNAFEDYLGEKMTYPSYDEFLAQYQYTVAG